MVDEVSLADILLDPFKLRVHYDSSKVDVLKGSILQVGLLSPLKVWLHEGCYWIVDGNYRYLALKDLGWVKVPVEAMPEGTTYEQALVAAVISNWHREEFYFMDKARSVRRLKEQGIPPLEICARLELPLDKGSPGGMYRFYRDFEDYVPDDVKEILSQLVAKITVRHGEALVLLTDHPDKQRELAERIVTQHLSGPKALSWAKNFLNPRPPPVECEFRDYVMELAKVVKEAPKTSCKDCHIQELCNEYKKAIFELAHELKPG